MDRSHQRRLGEGILVLALVAAHGWLAISSSIEKSVAFDEVAHIGGGILAWKTGDYRFNAESGILPQRWAALPYLWREVTVPGPEHPARRQGNVWIAGREILFSLDNDAASVTRTMRSMIALASMALGACVYFWSRALFGPAGALLSLVLYAVSPTILAHARLVTADLFAALFFLLAAGALWRVLDGVATGRATVPRVAMAALAVAGLLLSKHSGLLILPIAAVLTVMRAVESRRVVFGRRQALAFAGVAIAIAIGALAVIWAAYGFRYSAGPRQAGPRQAGPRQALPRQADPIRPADGDSAFVHSWDSVLARGGLAATGVSVARELRVLPEAYLWGLAYTFDTTRGRDAFLRGRTSKTGWWWFFPYAVAVKTPLPFFGLLALAAYCWWTASDRRDRLLRGIYRTAPLAAVLLVYWAAAVASPLNIGHRHMLPSYPVMFILAGGTACLAVRRRVATAAVILLAGLFVLESARIRPHYLAYFNQLAGGPANGYRHLVDSSLDWGQDLPALRDWIEDFRRRDRETPVYVSYLGTAVPELDDLGVEWLFSYFPVADYLRPPPPLAGGVYGVSVTLLQSMHMEALGPWTPQRESAYRDLRAQVLGFVELFQTAAGREPLSQQRTVAEWMGMFGEFDRLRCARLFRYLRTREPDARAGYSIHIYRLSAEEVEAALFGVWNRGVE
ncbi:MAG: hypothetical protein V3T72_21310 [Thermoanaerobaculia bacterium]